MKEEYDMRKVTAYVLCATLLASLTGCGGAGSGSGGAGSDNKDSAKGNTESGAAAGVETSLASDNKDSEGSASQPVTITFMNWGMAENTTIPAFEAMIAAFNESHPDIQVESIAEAYNSYLDQTLILNASKEMPDCLQVHNSMFSAMVSAGALADIDSYIEEDVRKDFYGNLMDALNYDGRQLGLPWAPSSEVLYCNMELLDKAGFDKVPDTMAELRDMAAAVTALGMDENGNTIYGLGLQTKAMDSSGFYFLPYLWNYGGDMCDEEGNITIYSPESMEAFDFVKGLVDDGITPVGQEIKDLRNMFANNQVAFIVDTAFGYAAIQNMAANREEFDAHTKLCAIPSDTGTPINFFIAHNLAVSQQSEHKEEAYTFIQWLSSAEAVEIYNTYSANIMPSRTSVEGLAYYSAPGNEYTQVYIEELPKARALPEKFSGFKASMLDIANALQRIIINHEDTASVVSDLEEQLKTDYVK